jgi:hypothetical protein
MMGRGKDDKKLSLIQEKIKTITRPTRDIRPAAPKAVRIYGRLSKKLGAGGGFGSVGRVGRATVGTLLSAIIETVELS